MKISANRRIYQSYNSQSSLDTASESPVIVFDSQSQKRFNNLATPCACPSRPVLKKNRLLNNSSALHGSSLAQQQHPERVPVKVASHVRFQSSSNIELPLNNFFESPAMNKSLKLKHPILSAAPFDYFLDSSVEESQQSENLGDISNAPSMVCSKSVSCSKPLDESILSDSDDEFNVWDNSSANEIGIDVQGEEENKVPMEFIELFYVRSQLYQEDKVAKPDVLEEVSVISKMCNKPMSMLKSSNLVDNIEKNFHLSIRKNAKQVSQLNFNAQKNQNSHFSSQSSLPKHTPKAFRISSVHPFQSANNNNVMTSSCQFQSKIAPFQNISQKEIELPLQISQFPQSLNKSNNNGSRNLFRFASNDVISMAPTNHINLASCNVNAREHVALSQTPQIRGNKSSIKINNLNTPSKYSVSKNAIDRMMRITSQATIQANKKIFSRGHFEEDGLRA